MTQKKTLYEILEVLPTDDFPEIRAAHARLSEALQMQQAHLSRENYNLQVRLLNIALSTLASRATRDVYDAQLSLQAARTDTAFSATSKVASAPPRTSGLSLMPSEPSLDAAQLRADAMLLRADALSLRADALGLKAGLVDPSVLGSGVAGSGGGFGSAGYGTGSGHGYNTSLQIGNMRAPSLGAVLNTPLSGTNGGIMTSLRSVIFALGAIVAVLIVLRLGVSIFSSRAGSDGASAGRQIEDKTYLREYYQTHGVMPASRAEAAALDADRQRKAAALKAEDRAERDQAKQETKEQKFVDDARKRGEQISTELRLAEERAQEKVRVEEQRNRSEKVMRDEIERRRIEAEQEKWRRTLTPGYR